MKTSFVTYAVVSILVSSALNLPEDAGAADRDASQCVRDVVVNEIYALPKPYRNENGGFYHTHTVSMTDTKGGTISMFVDFPNMTGAQRSSLHWMLESKQKKKPVALRYTKVSKSCNDPGQLIIPKYLHSVKPQFPSEITKEGRDALLELGKGPVSERGTKQLPEGTTLEEALNPTTEAGNAGH